MPAMMFLPILTGQRAVDFQSVVTTVAVALITVSIILVAAWFVAPASLQRRSLRAAATFSFCR